MARIPGELVTLKDGKTVLIKTCEPADAFPFMEFIERIGNETTHTLQFPGRKIPRVGVEDRWRRSLDDPNYLWIGAFSSGRMLGQISFYRESPSHPWIRENAKFTMAVLQEYWGTGLATNLWEKGEKAMRDWGIRRIEATVRTQNERGIAFYKKMGFDFEGTRKKCIAIGEEIFDEFYIAKLL